MGSCFFLTAGGGGGLWFTDSPRHTFCGIGLNVNVLMLGVYNGKNRRVRAFDISQCGHEESNLEIVVMAMSKSKCTKEI